MAGDRPARSALRILPMGERAFLVEVASADQAHHLSAAISAAEPPGLLQTVPGAETVMIEATSPGALSELKDVVSSIDPFPEPAGTVHDTLLVRVRYNGEDLEAVADELSLSREEVVRRHTGALYTVDFLGFAPGFGYLSGLDPALEVPRRSDPRTRVPAGAVAIAGRYSAIYPRQSPGGWRLLGHSDIELFNLDHNPPAALRAGMKVRFEAVAL